MIKSVQPSQACDLTAVSASHGSTSVSPTWFNLFNQASTGRQQSTIIQLPPASLHQPNLFPRISHRSARFSVIPAPLDWIRCDNRLGYNNLRTFLLLQNLPLFSMACPVNPRLAHVPFVGPPRRWARNGMAAEEEHLVSGCYGWHASGANRR